MDAPLFPDLPDDARLWVHVTDRPLTGDEEAALMDRLEAFADGWSHHRHAIDGRFRLVGGRVLVAAGYAEGYDVGGCGIDALVRALETAALDLGFGFAPALHVVYRDAEGRVQTCARPAFRAHVQAGRVTAATPVFDPGLTRLGEARAQGLERPAHASWHARVFRIPQAA